MALNVPENGCFEAMVSVGDINLLYYETLLDIIRLQVVSDN